MTGFTVLEARQHEQRPWMYPWQESSWHESYPPGLVLVAGEGWERDPDEDSILLVSVGSVPTPGSSSGHLVLVSCNSTLVFPSVVPS